MNPEAVGTCADALHALPYDVSFAMVLCRFLLSGSRFVWVDEQDGMRGMRKAEGSFLHAFLSAEVTGSWW